MKIVIKEQGVLEEVDVDLRLVGFASEAQLICLQEEFSWFLADVQDPRDGGVEREVSVLDIVVDDADNSGWKYDLPDPNMQLNRQTLEVMENSFFLIVFLLCTRNGDDALCV